MPHPLQARHQQILRLVSGKEALVFDFTHPAYAGASEWGRLYEAPAAAYKSWGREGSMPFYVRGVVNVGFRPWDKDFIFRICYWGFEFNGHASLLAYSNAQSEVEFVALLRTLTLVRALFPALWDAWAGRVQAQLKAGGAAAAEPKEEGTDWLMPTAGQSGGAAAQPGAAAPLSPEEAAIVVLPGWPEPPSEPCIRYLRAMDKAVAALTGANKRVTYSAVWRHMQSEQGLVWSTKDLEAALHAQFPPKSVPPSSPAVGQLLEHISSSAGGGGGGGGAGGSEAGGSGEAAGAAKGEAGRAKPSKPAAAGATAAGAAVSGSSKGRGRSRSKRPPSPAVAAGSGSSGSSALGAGSLPEWPTPESGGSGGGGGTRRASSLDTSHAAEGEGGDGEPSAPVDKRRPPLQPKRNQEKQSASGNGKRGAAAALEDPGEGQPAAQRPKLQAVLKRVAASSPDGAPSGTQPQGSGDAAGPTGARTPALVERARTVLGSLFGEAVGSGGNDGGGSGSGGGGEGGGNGGEALNDPSAVPLEEAGDDEMDLILPAAPDLTDAADQPSGRLPSQLRRLVADLGADSDSPGGTPLCLQLSTRSAVDFSNGVAAAAAAASTPELEETADLPVAAGVAPKPIAAEAESLDPPCQQPPSQVHGAALRGAVKTLQTPRDPLTPTPAAPVMQQCATPDNSARDGAAAAAPEGCTEVVQKEGEEEHQGEENSEQQQGKRQKRQQQSGFATKGHRRTQPQQQQQQQHQAQERDEEVLPPPLPPPQELEQEQPEQQQPSAQGFIAPEPHAAAAATEPSVAAEPSPRYLGLLRENEALRRELESLRQQQQQQQGTADATATELSPAEQAAAALQAAAAAQLSALVARTDPRVTSAALAAPPPPLDEAHVIAAGIEGGDDAAALAYAKVLLYRAIDSGLGHALEVLAGSSRFELLLRECIASEVARHSAVLSNLTQWRAAVRDALPAAVSEAGPTLLQAVRAAPAAVREAAAMKVAADAARSDVFMDACYSRLAQDPQTAESLSARWEAAQRDATAAMAERLVSSEAVQQQVQDRISAHLPAALDRWLASADGAARLEAVAAREARSALLAPAAAEKVVATNAAAAAAAAVPGTSAVAAQEVVAAAVAGTDVAVTAAAAAAAGAGAAAAPSLLSREVAAALREGPSALALVAQAVTAHLLRPLLPPSGDNGSSGGPGSAAGLPDE